MKKLTAIFGILAVAACGGGDAAEGDGVVVDSTSITTVPGTINPPTVVATTDSVVQTTPIGTDTVHGQATVTDTPAAVQP